ncbi:MAG: sensor histidine kinase, partial [Bdellovibrionales bacterium]
ILDTLIRNQAPHFAPDWVKLLSTFLISLLTIYVVLSVRPAKGLMMLGVSLLIFLVFSLLIFAAFQLVFPVAHPLVAVFICYYFVIPYRLIIENRKSWEYYQKNKLLTQVEELKSNFMRMMSHDLRTPLARIQGMVELMRKEPRGLSASQQYALETISESSEELTDFIGSILSLSRIESKEMKLQLRSRDVNQILRDVIRKVEYLAKRKDIEIVSELEPLFSIKVDEDLLKTVFANLLENAVKYSPDGRRILVTTEELNNEVVIQVADQGQGIPADDLQHVFERFYRARNSRATTAGNGLGLYLAKYFVELHNGRIEVESEVDKGSTFTVRLPMDLSLETEPPVIDIQGGLHV